MPLTLASSPVLHPAVPLMAAFALLAGCASTPPPAPPPPPPPGMEQILGQPQQTAILLLGQPRLDRPEGKARQLQFVGGCVLDVFYYPGPSGVPLATHADARLPDGRDFAPGECLQLLQRSKAPPAPVTPAPSAKPAPKRRG